MRPNMSMSTFIGEDESDPSYKFELEHMIAVGGPADFDEDAAPGPSFDEDAAPAPSFDDVAAPGPTFDEIITPKTTDSEPSFGSMNTWEKGMAQNSLESEVLPLKQEDFEDVIEEIIDTHYE